jgi:hypothetical protein
MQKADSRATGSSARMVSSAIIVDVSDLMRFAGLAAELTMARSSGLGLVPEVTASSNLHNAPRQAVSRERMSLDRAARRLSRCIKSAEISPRNAPAASFVAKGSLRVARRSPEGRRASPEFAIFRVIVGTALCLRSALKPIRPKRTADVAPPISALAAAPVRRQHKPLAFCQHSRGRSTGSQL